MSTTKEKKKKPTKRSRSKYPNLDPDLNLKIRRDLIEVDYLDKLNDDQKGWLDKFNNESINASFDKNNKKNLHKTKEQKKACYDANNARNRDILSRAQAQGKSISLEDPTGLEQTLSLSESSENGSSDGENL